MLDRFVHVRMGVRLFAIPLRSMPMLMVLVVAVGMRVLDSLVCVPVAVPFRKMDRRPPPSVRRR